MSGICGLFNLDDKPVAEAELRAMSAMLERRGPERTGKWNDGPCGLGHTLLATTPELLFERQPFRHSETGCVITADVRLDNRDELIGALELHERRDSIGDAELILLSYLRWGELCPQRLLGDFAFAIWDPRHWKLFCARDHFGMRPLYYHSAPGQRFVFASDARAILVLPQVPYRINQGRIADFLVPQLEWIDYTSTFFNDVYRLPPGHKATVTPRRLDVTEYWEPAPGPALGPMSDDDYREGFLDILTKAVDSRLRAPQGKVGSMLSGGMDSGSVVAVAKDLMRSRGDRALPTFSAAQPRGINCAESQAIYAALGMPSIEPTVIQTDAVADAFRTLIAGHEEPFDAQLMILKAIYEKAREHGQSVVLDGGGGDVVLGEGSYIVRLIRGGGFRLALAEIAAEGKFWSNGTHVSDFLSYFRRALVPEAVKKRARPVIYRRLAAAYLKDSTISRAFADSVDIDGRCVQLRRMYPSGWTPDYATERCNAIRPNVTGGRERYARIAAASATEARDPFLDKRVVEYCAWLPGRFRLKDGWPKMILRDLMADRLPDEVRWCRGKPHIGWLFGANVTKAAHDNGELSLAGLQSDLGDYVDSAALARAWQHFRESGYSEAISSLHILSIWVRENANRPVVSD